MFCGGRTAGHQKKHREQLDAFKSLKREIGRAAKVEMPQCMFIWVRSSAAKVAAHQHMCISDTTTTSQERATDQTPAPRAAAAEAAAAHQ